MRLLKSPVALFLIVAIVAVAALIVGTNERADSAASDEAIAEASSSTEILAKAAVGPLVPPGLARLTSRQNARYFVALDQLDREIKQRLIDLKLVRQINIWTEDGVLVYSSDPALIGQKFELDADQRRVLRAGGVGSKVVDPDRPENQRPEGASSRDPQSGASVTESQIQIYTPMEYAGRKPLLFETYYNVDDISQRSSEIYGSFRWITLGPLVLLILLATLLLVGLARELTRAGKDRERLLRSAMDASDAERRRIARDLHDGVVQDLAGTAFSVSAVARNPETPPDARDTLTAAGTSLRSGLTSLRSLLAEIHPPDLHAEGLASALADLIAPAAAAGIQASVSVEGTETVSNQDAALVWRVAQEAVRNAIRHSGASTIAVTVRGNGDGITLEVVDDGTGFDPAGARDPDRYGLRGLRSLVADSGGTLEVRSSPGEGTTVRMEVDAR
ncbi:MULTISPECIES: sensor histidine kinase [unclassified Nocardioides]|uniref:sensor histidine kinase n=1 Tax=unclassified Nocardioides TaxID=2615069 RepID=UPI0009F0E993|nr:MULTISPECIES: sensor histidine kinase [unclassified Nocardioides]GAW48366.1 ATPase domain-containing protein [Nocardioides sp. PD653-B2]GAW53291.1 ATPase domain-containing protein [Nocardioides sp. PD653]